MTVYGRSRKTNKGRARVGLSSGHDYVPIDLQGAAKNKPFPRNPVPGFSLLL